MVNRRGCLREGIEQLRGWSVPMKCNRRPRALNGTHTRLGMKAYHAANRKTQAQPWGSGPSLPTVSNSPASANVNDLRAEVGVLLIAVDQDAVNLGIGVGHIVYWAGH